MSETITPLPMVAAHEVYAAICSEGGYVTVPHGNSMWPMLRDKRDMVHLVSAPNLLCKGDLALYLRRDGTLVLHRVREVRPEGYTMCGDAQIVCEYGVPFGAVMGVAKGFWRDDTYLPCTAKRYRLYVKVWCASLRLRKCLLWCMGRSK